MSAAVAVVAVTVVAVAVVTVVLTVGSRRSRDWLKTTLKINN